MKKIQNGPGQRSAFPGPPKWAIQGPKSAAQAIAWLTGWLALGCAPQRSAQPATKIEQVTAATQPPVLPSSDRQTAMQPTNRVDDFIDVARLEPTIRVDLRYATAQNFTGQVVYPPSARCYLRARVAQRLQAVQRDLATQGLGLKVFDCYRPLSVQRRFFALVPDERYVANPAKGSRHNKGAAVDLTLVDSAGVELAMPTPFDDFSERAHRDYSALPQVAIDNRACLEAAMVRHGFVPLPTEWWHFDDRDAKGDGLSDVRFEDLVPASP